MDLLDKLDLAEETQRMLRAEYPAVAALDSGAVKDLPNTGENNQQLQEQMQQRFAQIQAQIDELTEKLQENPHLALHLDVMVSETLYLTQELGPCSSLVIFAGATPLLHEV